MTPVDAPGIKQEVDDLTRMQLASNENRPTPRTFGLSWPLVFGVASFAGLILLSGSSTLLADPDIYWHVTAGHWIVEHHSPPTTDPFSYTMHGARWVAQEWLAEIVLSWIKTVSGWTGLVVAAAASYAVTLAYLTRFLMTRMKPIHAILFVGLASAMLYTHLLSRPHVLAWPLLAVWVGTLVNATETRRGPPWWLLGVLLIWANLHGSFPLAIVLAGALAVEAVVESRPENRRTTLLQWAPFVLLTPLVGLATPAGWDGLMFSFRLMSMSTVIGQIAEWKSPDFHLWQPLEAWLFVMLGAAMLGRLRLPWLRLVMVLGLTHLGLLYQRDVSILGLVGPMLLAAPVGRQWQDASETGRQADQLNRVFEALAARARWRAVSGAGSLAAALALVAIHIGTFAPAPSATPDAALRAARAAGAHGPVLNAYNLGGYLIYHSVPVFIDTRADMYGEAFIIRQEKALALTDPDDLARLVDQYHIEWTFLEPGTPAVALLDHLSGWRRVYADDTAVVHIHDSLGQLGAATGNHRRG